MRLETRLRASALQASLNDVISTIPLGQDTNTSVQREVLTGDEVSTAPVASVVSSGTTNIANTSQSQIVSYSGGGTVTGSSTSDQPRAIVITDNTAMNVALGGAGKTTVALGSGEASITAASTGGTTVIGGAGNLALTATDR